MRTLQMAFILSKILIGGIFIYTGIIHIADPEGFTRAVSAYDLLPIWSVGMFARVLPWVELAAGLAIGTGIYMRAGSLIAALLLIAFILALSISLYRGLDISCGCFSTSSEAEAISWIDLVRDLALLATSSFLFLCATKWRNTGKIFPGKYLVPGLIVFLVSGAMLFQIHNRNPCEKVTVDAINTHKQLSSATILSKRPVHGLCEVLLKEGDRIVSVYTRESFLIVGKMYRERADLTEEGYMLLKSREFNALRTDLDESVALKHTPEGGIRHTLYMFSSPDCPYCHEVLEDLLPVLDETKTELKMLLVSKGSAETMAIKAACLQMDLNTYLSNDWTAQTDSNAPACREGAAILKKSVDLGVRLGITSVPTFFTQDGLMLKGSNIDLIKQILKE